MTAEELNTLWAETVVAYWPNAKQVTSREGTRQTKTKWFRVLQPWTAGQVSQAVIAYLRGGGRHLPDVQELTPHLPPLPAKAASKDVEDTPERAARIAKDMAALKKAYEKIKNQEVPPCQDVAHSPP